MHSKHDRAESSSYMAHTVLSCPGSRGTPHIAPSENMQTYAFLPVTYVYSSLSNLLSVPGMAPSSLFSMIFDVAAISASFGVNPLVVPSTLTRKRSPFSRRLPPTDAIFETSSSKPLSVLLAMATLPTPNSSPMADDAKTGSFACTRMMSPSRTTDLNR